MWLKFFIRRFWRIVPPYFIAFGVFLAGDILTGQLTSYSSVTAQVWPHLFLIHNFWELTHFGINPSFWSIAVEAQLYLIYPLLCYLIRRSGWKSFMIIALVCEIGIRSASAAGIFPADDWIRFLTHGPLAYWFSWSTGAWIAEAWIRGHRLPFAKLPLPWVFAGVLATWFIRPLDHLFFLMAALTTAVVLGRAVAGTKSQVEPNRSRLIPALLSFIGTISYSFYLWHQPFISLWNKVITRYVGVLEPYWLFLGLIVSIIPITILSWCSYRWIEIPAIAVGKRFLNRIQNH